MKKNILATLFIVGMCLHAVMVVAQAKNTVHYANTRGLTKTDWLSSHHTFSFNNYYDPNRVGFGALYVLNDDSIGAGRGFGMHPHNNMEIITIVLSGAVKHKDNQGHEGIVKAGDVQVMSAGTGVYHSEANASTTEVLKLLQIWVFPNKSDITPRYDQANFNQQSRINKWQYIIQPQKSEKCLSIQQNSWFAIGKFNQGKIISYTKKQSKNGVYIFVISGKINIAGKSLSSRDGIGIENLEKIDLKAVSTAEVLLMEVPMLK